MATTSHLITADELWAMPEDGGRHELVQGALQSMNPVGSLHAWIVSEVAATLRDYLRKCPIGEILTGDPGFVLRRDPDTVLAPDIAIVRKARFGDFGIAATYFEGPPDLAIEVVSPRDRFNDVDAKAHDYIAAGAALVWVINPRWRNVTIYQADRTVRVVAETEELTAPELLPGSSCHVADLFPKQPT